MPVGRPRKTRPEDVLEKAMKSFWSRGFEATSMNDLVVDTGMAKPGLYALFGDKETLFGRALDHYAEVHARPLLDRFCESSASLEDSLREMLEAVGQAARRGYGPGGCLMVNSVVECANGPDRLRGLVEKHSARRLKAVADRFRRAISEGDLPLGSDPESLAEFFSGQTIALSVMGRTGAGPDAMAGFVDIAIGALPRPSD